MGMAMGSPMGYGDRRDVVGGSIVFCGRRLERCVGLAFSSFGGFVDLGVRCGFPFPLNVAVLFCCFLHGGGVLSYPLPGVWDWFILFSSRDCVCEVSMICLRDSLDHGKGYLYYSCPHYSRA